MDTISGKTGVEGHVSYLLKKRSKTNNFGRITRILKVILYLKSELKLIFFLSIIMILESEMPLDSEDDEDEEEGDDEDFVEDEGSSSSEIYENSEDDSSIALSGLNIFLINGLLFFVF